MPSSRPAAQTLTVLALLLAAGPAVGQDTTEQALARAQSLLRQVSAQKQELEAANARLTAEIAALERRLAAAETELRQAGASLTTEQRRAAQASGALEDIRARLTRTETSLQETADRLRATNLELREAREQSAGLEVRLRNLEAELAESERRNLALYEANLELLELYRRKGPWTALLQREPVTGLKNVEIENILQQYQLRLQESLTDSNREAQRAEQR